MISRLNSSPPGRLALRKIGGLQSAAEHLRDRFHHHAVRDEGVHDGRGRRERHVESLDVEIRVAERIVVVNAQVGEVEEVLLAGMADVVVERQLAPPIRGRDRDDLRAALLGLFRRVNRRGVHADVVEDDEQVVLADAVVADEAVGVAGGALDFQVLQRLAHGADVVADDRIDVGQAAGAEEHLEDHHAGVSAAAIDVHQPILLVGVGDHPPGAFEFRRVMRFDRRELRGHVLQVFLPVLALAHARTLSVPRAAAKATF